MIRFFSKLLFLLFVSFVINTEAAQITGKIQLHESWQPVLFLASIDSPENLNLASPDFIIAKTLINPDGSFFFKDLTLPSDPRIYRLYLVKNKNALVEFDSTVEKNYFHIIADNNSSLNLYAKASNIKFELFEINDLTNQLLLDFNKIIEEKRNKKAAGISKAQKDILQLDIENYIRNFVDSCQNSIVGLFALYQIEERETDFLRQNKFYYNFQKKINSQFPQSAYADAYNNMLNELIGFRELVCEIPGVAPKWKDYLLVLESVLILFLLIFIFILLRRKGKESSNRKMLASYHTLTQKEKQIFELMAAGKSNKEIAAELFIEVSTVKTHINNIYKQLKLSNRKEAISHYNSFQK